MFKMIAAAVLLSTAGVTLASDASYDLKQVSTEKAAAAKDAGAKTDAPRSTCSCQHS